MTLLCDLDDVIEHAKGGAISIGNFDGVHVGHAVLLKELKRQAAAIGGPAVVITFDPHPASVLRPELAPIPLTTLERRTTLLAGQGVDTVIRCKPTGELLSLTAEQFFEKVICEKFNCRAMVEGPNFFFGKDRKGDVELLQNLCDAASIQLSIVKPSKTDGDMISSTQIRKLISSGEIEAAGKLLTAPYCIHGRVVTGVSRGRTLGFPTANLTDISVVVPKLGVYAGKCIINSKTHLAAVNIGPNATFDEGQCKVEVHLLDFSADLYDQTLEVQIDRRIRDVVKFPTVEALVQQLNQDIANVRGLPDMQS